MNHETGKHLRDFSIALVNHDWHKADEAITALNDLQYPIAYLTNEMLEAQNKEAAEMDEDKGMEKDRRMAEAGF